MYSTLSGRKDKAPNILLLFGGKEGWSSDDWTASDDRVRGGESQSYLEIDGSTARFHGVLDTETLGGAGFASQRTTGDDREWDLSNYAGIQIAVKKGDKKRYTFILKDTLLPPDEETAREKASISYECDFELPPQTEPGKAHDKLVFIPWDSFNATYRGKLKKDADPLDTKQVKRISIMMRSFFGTQEGDFSLTIKSITALKDVPSSSSIPHDSKALESGTLAAAPRQSVLQRVLFLDFICEEMRTTNLMQIVASISCRPITILLPALATGLLVYRYI